MGKVVLTAGFFACFTLVAAEAENVPDRQRQFEEVEGAIQAARSEAEISSAIDKLKELEAQAFPPASILLGKLHLIEPWRNEHLARQHFLRAADTGGPRVQREVAQVFYYGGADGYKIEIDFALAFELFKEAAEGGDLSSALLLGGHYEVGWGIEQDKFAALYYYHVAAASGDAQGQYRYGKLLRETASIAQDLREAIEWLTRSAEQGHVFAASEVAAAYEDGEGVAQNYVLAHMWYNIAASRSIGTYREGIVGARDQLEVKMSRDQIAEAQDSAQSWLDAFERQ